MKKFLKKLEKENNIKIGKLYKLVKSNKPFDNGKFILFDIVIVEQNYAKRLKNNYVTDTSLLLRVNYEKDVFLISNIERKQFSFHEFEDNNNFFSGAMC